MKKKFYLKSFTILCLSLILVVTSSAAFADNTIETDAANTLVKLKIMQGYEDGSLRLNNNIKRSEFITLIVRMLGYDKDTEVSKTVINFKDVKKTHWALNYVKAAVKYKLVIGSPDNKFSPDSNITYAEALTVMIRALGYENTLQGTWPENVLNKSTELGLNKDLDLTKDKKLTRGEMAVIVNNSLTVVIS